MTYDQAITKLLLEMQERTTLTLLQFEEVKRCVRMAAGIGYDEGRKNKAHRRAVLMKRGRTIEPYESVKDAARASGLAERTVRRALKGSPIVSKFKFMYA
jgi:hypothetical protein